MVINKRIPLRSMHLRPPRVTKVTIEDDMHLWGMYVMEKHWIFIEDRIGSWNKLKVLAHETMHWLSMLVTGGDTNSFWDMWLDSNCKIALWYWRHDQQVETCSDES